MTVGPLADGQHSLAVQAADARGNHQGPVASRGFTVDTSAPETIISAGPPATSDDSTPTFWFGASEAGASFECSSDGGAFSPCTSPRTLAPLAPGQHRFAVRGRDVVGNVDATPATLLYTILAPASDRPPPDQAKPIIAIAGALADGLVKTTGVLQTAELPQLARRRGITIAGLHVPARGSLATSAHARRHGRTITALSGTTRSAGPATNRLRLRASRPARRLFARARSLKLSVTTTFTDASGLRLTASGAVDVFRHWLTLKEVARIARRWIPRYFGDRPTRLTLRNCRRQAPARIRCGQALWRHKRRWWYVRLRVSEGDRGLRQRMSDAALW